MTKEQVFGVIRHTMTAIGTFLVAKDLVIDMQWQDLTGAALALVSIIWSITAKKTA